MGSIATRQFGQILDHVESIVAIEILCAAQGIDFRRQMTGKGDARLGAGTGLVYDLVRSKVAFLETDACLKPFIDEVRELITSGAIREKVRSGLSSSLDDIENGGDEWVAQPEGPPALVR